MSETPKFEVIDRRKLKAQEEQEAGQTAPPPSPAADGAPPEDAAPGPRLVESRPDSAAPAAAAGPPEAEPEFAPPPTTEESHEQKAAYDASAQRVEDLIRAQNPAAGAPPPVTFEHLVQQFYVSALIQMGAGTPEGQQPRVDILGARSTIDLLGILDQKTRGNLTPAEDRMLQSVLYELRMNFLELTGMISMQPVPPPPQR